MNEDALAFYCLIIIWRDVGNMRHSLKIYFKIKAFRLSKPLQSLQFEQQANA